MAGRCQARGQAVHGRRLHGPGAAGRLQLAARVPADGDPADRPARPLRHQRLRRGRALRGHRRTEGRHRHDRAGEGGRGPEQGGLGDRLRGRHTRRALGSERRDGRGHEGRQPRLRPHRDPSFLEAARDRDRARRRNRARDGRHVPADRVRRQPGRRARLAHGPRRRLQAVLEHCPLADRVRRGAALLLARLLPRAGHGVPQLALGHAGHAGRVGALARAFGPVRALHELRGLVRQDIRLDRGRDHPAAVAQLQRVGDPFRRGAERRARPAGGHPRGGRAEGGARQAGAARGPR